MRISNKKMECKETTVNNQEEKKMHLGYNDVSRFGEFNSDLV